VVSGTNSLALSSGGESSPNARSEEWTRALATVSFDID